ncbi:hypothetical protein QBC45DRAFT_353 [Copromyces sp. CBS 386.78]|nr:hypothetical protein QBC45DRAFT_353 [Copromyces sp. CBS 386.78]
MTRPVDDHWLEWHSPSFAGVDHLTFSRPSFSTDGDIDMTTHFDSTSTTFAMELAPAMPATPRSRGRPPSAATEERRRAQQARLAAVRARRAERRTERRRIRLLTNKVLGGSALGCEIGFEHSKLIEVTFSASLGINRWISGGFRHSLYDFPAMLGGSDNLCSSLRRNHLRSLRESPIGSTHENVALWKVVPSTSYKVGTKRNQQWLQCQTLQTGHLDDLTKRQRP